MDGTMIENLRHQNIGKCFAFGHLQEFLRLRKLELEEQITKLNQK